MKALVAIAVLLGSAAGMPLAAADAKTPVRPYTIVNGKVDAATFRGWKVYHQACYLCHGLDAVGTQLAPSLVEKLRNLSADQFAIKVATSYRIVTGLEASTSDDPTARRDAMLAGVQRREDPVLLMPAWEGNASVKPHLSDLYAYLKARSDGALGPGKPHRAGAHH